MTAFLRLCAILFLCLCIVIPVIGNTRSHHIQDSLARLLSHTTRQTERYTLLRHLADNSNKNERLKYYLQLYSEACKVNDEKVQIEALLELGNRNKLDSIKYYISLAEKLTPTAGSKGLIVFLKGQWESIYSRNASEEEKAEHLKQLLKEYKADANKEIDIYDRILKLRTLCICLGYSIQSDIYTQYLEEQQKLTSQLPPENYYLRASVLTQLSILYTFSEEYKKAIETDKKLLEYIHDLERYYRKQGRIYRNYYTSYYAIYRRMLNNYPGLSAAEVDSCYAHLQQMCSLSEDVYWHFTRLDPKPHLYYHMAKNQYEKASVFLDSLWQKPPLQRQVPNHILLRYQIEIAQALGEKDKELKALKEYITVLHQLNQTRNLEKYKELQILNDVESLNQRNRETELEAEHNTKSLMGYIVSLLTVLLILILIFHLHSRRLVKRLKQSEQALKKEKMTLLETQEKLVQARDQAEASDRIKTVFIQNMSHEIRTPLNSIVGFSQLIASEAQNINSELKTYSNLILNSSELLLKLVNDLLELSAMESGKLKIVKSAYKINELCQTVVDSTKDKVKPGVKMTFTATREDTYTLVTDSMRVQQILLNFLNNAVKYTEQGEINLTYTINEQEQQVIFAISDSGPGIPSDKAEQIFNRFEKLNSFSQGNGLGLHICRLIAQALQGEVKLDTTYTRGARFIFIHPLPR